MMKIALVRLSAILLGVSGCASTVRQNEPPPPSPQIAPDKVAPVALAPPAAKPVPVDEFAATRDPGNPLSTRSVYFEFDDYSIQPKYQSVIDAHGAFIAAKPNAKVMVQGNADEQGSAEYNLALGQKRAMAVKRALKLRGVKEPQVEAISFGEEKPRALGHDEAARSVNRRADIAYPGEY